ncbi:GTP-binding protein [Lactarius pseudohatsudake]|nr:GTP-binding protein [Lactarius pseudohatsudake]
MDTQQPSRRAPKIEFRVLIIGRANAGKTSILQRICETTESPTIYRRGDDWDSNEERGEHSIDDELVFSNHTGYVFHDSCGIESGCTKELEVLREFIRRKCGEKRLGDKLHAIWYCIPMDNQRPGLDLKFFNDICPDQNVPVIAVFTKYDQFRRNVKIDLMDYGNPDESATEVTEKLFQEHYLHPLGNRVVFVRLEQMHRTNRRCDDLIEKTAAALDDDTVTLMLLVVQKGNLELSVKTALKRLVRQFEMAKQVTISTNNAGSIPVLGSSSKAQRV